MMVLSNFKSTQREFQRELVEITRHKKYILFIKIWHHPFIAVQSSIFERGQSLISQNLLQCILYTGFFFVLSLQHKWIARISFIFHSLVFFFNFTFWAYNGQTDVFFIHPYSLHSFIMWLKFEKWIFVVKPYFCRNFSPFLHFPAGSNEKW